MALTVGLTISADDKAFAQACADVAASNDVGFLQGVAADSSSACQQIALERLLVLAPAGGPLDAPQEATSAPNIQGLSAPGRSDASQGNEGQESNSATEPGLY